MLTNSKDRFTFISLLVSSLPPTSMHLIPSLIPEVVLGLKEPSEKARTAAFDTIVVMGRKMGEGGIVKRDLVDGMDEDGMETKEGTIFFCVYVLILICFSLRKR